MDCAYIYVRKKKKSKSKLKRRVFSLIFACLFLFGAITFVDKSVNPTIITFTESTVNSTAADVINKSIVATIEKDYTNIIVVERDKDQNITMVSTNAIVINRLLQSIIGLCKTKMGEFLDQGIKIPIGTLSGISALSGRGSSMNISLKLIDTIAGDFSSEFSSAGINQTLYRLYLTVDLNIAVILAGKNEIITSSQNYLIYECIIVGKIPAVVIG